MYRLIGKKDGEFLVIDGQELHHLKVLRLKEGDTIEVNDLNGNVYVGNIIAIEKNRGIIKPLSRLEIKEPELEISLYLCLPNQLSKVDDVLESISQLGVKRFVPVISKRSAVKISDVLKKMEKWDRIAIQSIKQCKRLFPVVVEKPEYLHKIISEDEVKFVFYEKERRNKLKDIEIKKPKTVSVVIGPEGGFEESEIDFLMERGFLPLSLGENILRLETAIIVALCQVDFKFN